MIFLMCLARLWNSQGIASRFREGADDDGVLGPAGWGVGGFGGGGDGFVDAFHGHLAGEDLERGIWLGGGGVLGELLVEFRGFGAGDDLDDIGAAGRSDLDFESAFVRAGDVDSFVVNSIQLRSGRPVVAITKGPALRTASIVPFFCRKFKSQSVCILARDNEGFIDVKNSL